MATVHLEKEMETLLIPLLARARDARSRRPILGDRYAAELADRLEGVKAWHIPAKTRLMMCMRARILDRLTLEHLKTNPGCLVIQTGCGLDSRRERLGKPVPWVDLDLPPVIRLRGQYLNEEDGYTMVGAPVQEAGWIRDLPEAPGVPLVLAEGLFMYLSPEDLATALGTLKERLGEFRLVADVFSLLSVRRMERHPLLNRTGARIRWGMDRPEELEGMLSGLRVDREIRFTDPESLEGLSLIWRTVFRLAGKIPAAADAHRILVCQAI